jgi:hypothetical protein
MMLLEGLSWGDVDNVVYIVTGILGILGGVWKVVKKPLEFQLNGFGRRVKLVEDQLKVNAGQIEEISIGMARMDGKIDLSAQKGAALEDRVDRTDEQYKVLSDKVDHIAVLLGRIEGELSRMNGHKPR